MTLRARDLVPLRDLSDTIKTRAAHLYNNVKLCRVTHTLKSIKLLLKALAELRAITQTNIEYEREIRAVLLQCQAGPTEFVLMNGKIHISGSFDTEALRAHLLVNEFNPVIEGVVHVEN